MKKVKLLFSVRIYVLVSGKDGNCLKRITNIVPFCDDVLEVPAADYVSPERRLYEFYNSIYPDSVIEISLAKVDYNLPTD